MIKIITECLKHILVNIGKSGPLPLSWRNPISLTEWLVALIQKVENNCIRKYCCTYFILWINVIVIFYIMKWLGTNASLCRSGYYLILKWKISFLEFVIISLHSQRQSDSSTCRILFSWPLPFTVLMDGLWRFIYSPSL